MLAVLGLHYADQNVPGRLDRSLDALIRYQLRGYQPATRVLVTLGNPAQIAILIAIVAGAAAVVRHWSGVLLAIVGTIAAAAITEVISSRLSGGCDLAPCRSPAGTPPPWPQWPPRPRFSSGAPGGPAVPRYAC